MKKYLMGGVIVLLFVVGFIPSTVKAATIYFETTKSTVSAGDTFIVTAKIDAEGANINSVDGNISLESTTDNFVVNDFSLAKSIFNLWPRTPSLSKDGKVISFVGGVPGGFKLDKAIIFNIVIETEKEGVITISPKDFAVFANDGKGTRVPTKISNLTVNVAPKNEGNATLNEWNNLVLSDKTNPENFTIILGRESSMFEGQRFAFFTAVDNQSGISYYEVSEDGKPAVRSGSMYVLQNQDENITPNILVTAYDKAGNKRTVSYEKPGFAFYGFSLNFIIIILAIVIIWIIFRIIQKRRNKKNVKSLQ